MVLDVDPRKSMNGLGGWDWRETQFYPTMAEFFDSIPWPEGVLPPGSIEAHLRKTEEAATREAFARRYEGQRPPRDDDHEPGPENL